MAICLALLYFVAYFSTCNSQWETPNTTCLSLTDTLYGIRKDKYINGTALADCCDAFLLSSQSGVYWFGTVGQEERLFCDMDTADGGWIVIARRNGTQYAKLFTIQNDSERDKYQRGFGLLDKEFWFGLDHLHNLTSSQTVQLRFDLNGSSLWAQYEDFAVGPPSDHYRLRVGNYSGGNLPDSFSFKNGQPFRSCWNTKWWGYTKVGICNGVHPFFPDYILWLKDTVPSTFYPAQELHSIEMKIRIKRDPCPN